MPEQHQEASSVLGKTERSVQQLLAVDSGQLWEAGIYTRLQERADFATTSSRQAHLG